MSNTHEVSAALRVSPTEEADVERLTWVIDLDTETVKPGALGSTRLVLPDGGAVWTDYARPERLLRLSAPFGTQQVSHDFLSDDDLERDVDGQFEASTHQWLTHLLGSEFVESMSNGQDVSTGDVNHTDAWVAAGQLTMLHRYVDCHKQRLDGLWALEAAMLLEDGLGGSQSFPREVARLIAKTKPVLKRLDREWFDGLDPRVQESIRRQLVLATRTDSQVKEYDLPNQLGLVDEQGLSAAVPLIGQPLHLEEAPSYLGGRLPGSASPGPSSVQAEPSDVYLDYTCAGTVSRGSWHRDGPAIKIRLTPEPSMGEAMRSIEVRASYNGRLVASAVSLQKNENTGLWETDLLLLPMLADRSLFVVAGTELNTEGYLPEAFEHKQALHFGRLTADAMRVGDSAAAATFLRQFDALAVREPGQLSASGALAAHLLTGDPATRRLLLKLQNRVGDEDHFSAVRSLANTCGEAELAGLAEVSLIGTGSSEFSPNYVQPLILALLAAGNTEEADRLLHHLHD